MKNNLGYVYTFANAIEFSTIAWYTVYYSMGELSTVKG